MKQVEIFEVAPNLSKLIRILESKEEDCITITNNGKPYAKLTLINNTPVENRIGIGKGKFCINRNFDVDNKTITDIFV